MCMCTLRAVQLRFQRLPCITEHEIHCFIKHRAYRGKTTKLSNIDPEISLFKFKLA